MPYYNMTQLSNIENLPDLFLYANASTGATGILFGLISISLFFIMLFTLKRWDFDKALLSSSFAVFILTLILTFAGLVSFYFPIAFLIIMAFTGMYMYMQER